MSRTKTVFQLFGLVEYTNDEMMPQLGRGLFLTSQELFDNRGDSAQVTPGTSIAPLFFGNSTAAIRSWGFLTALSATGRLSCPEIATCHELIN